MRQMMMRYANCSKNNAALAIGLSHRGDLARSQY